MTFLSRCAPSLTLPLAVLLTAGGCTEAPHATLILAGGPVWSMTGDAPAEAVALRGDTVLAVGSRAEVEIHRGPDTEYVELDGAAVLPAFVDHHVHLLNLGLALLNRDAGETTFLEVGSVGSLEELGALISGRVSTVGSGAWVLGQGWSQASWGTEALPDSDILDRAAPDNPVLLTRTDAHAGWANAAALRAAGLGPESEDPPGGRLIRRPNGSLTGVLLERAVEPVMAAVPPMTTEQLVAAFRAGAEHLAARGVTRAYDAGFLTPPGIVDLGTDFSALLEALVEDDRSAPLPLWLGLMVPAPSELAEDLVSNPDRIPALTDRLQVTHVKLFADGALGSRSAALTHPYADDPSTHGVPRMSADEIHRWAARALDAGLDVATHAIGNAAVHAALDAYERLLAERPGLDPNRLRIEHFSYADEADFERAVSMRIPLSIQSVFNSPPGDDPTFGEMRVGRVHGDAVYAWRDLADRGALLLEGTDLYALPGPPLLPLQWSLTAQNALGITGDGPAGRGDAVRASVRFLPPHGDAPIEGRLIPGRRSDLVVLSVDPLTDPLDVFASATILGTLHRGHWSFRAP